MPKYESTYDIYVTFYGVMRSGTKLNPTDYVHRQGGASHPFNTQERLAVSLATQDVQNNMPLRSKAEFDSELRTLVGS